MKNFGKYLFAGLILFSIGFSAFAKDVSLKADPDKVIIVGKIKVVFDEDRDFIAKTRGLTEKEMETSDGYTVPYVIDPSDTFGGNLTKYYRENKTNYNNGETFIVQVRRSKKNRNTLMFRNPFEMYFYGSGKSFIYLPLPADFNVEVPDDIDAIYLGTFTYYITGDNFTVHEFERVDEYDTAQEELDHMLGTHCDMIRAALKTVEVDAK